MLNEGTSLALQQNARLQTFQTMPDVLGNIHTITSTFLAENAGVHSLTLVIIGRQPDLAPQYHKGLVLVGVMMYWDKSAWLQGVEESVTLVLQTLMEVIVLPQSW